MTTPDASIHSLGERPVTARLPIPIDEGLDRMVQAVEDGGERTTRREMIATAIFALTQANTEEVTELLRWQRAATLGDLEPSEA